MFHDNLDLFSDNVISVHDLTVFNLPLLCTVTQTKGATAFDLDLKVCIILFVPETGFVVSIPLNVYLESQCVALSLTGPSVIGIVTVLCMFCVSNCSLMVYRVLICSIF